MNIVICDDERKVIEDVGSYAENVYLRMSNYMDSSRRRVY